MPPTVHLLGQLPLPKPTLEGRLQRQLVLFEQDMGIKDPMEFFEEITRHRLLKGILPIECIYTSEELDALVAAFTAYLAVNQPRRSGLDWTRTGGSNCPACVWLEGILFVGNIICQ